MIEMSLLKWHTRTSWWRRSARRRELCPRPARGQLAWLAAALLSLGAVACSAEGQFCTLIGCQDGLLISLNGGSFGDAGSTDEYQIVISEVTPTPEVVPMMNCSLASTGAGSELLCSSMSAHSDFGRTIQFHFWRPSKLMVTVSRGGAEVREETFEPVFTTREINGPGCGTCTQASIDMALEQ